MSAPLTPDQLKELLSTPRALFVIMLLASVVSAWQQIRSANQGGAELTWADYFKHSPETLTMILTNIIGFIALIFSEQLNFASALGLGYASNNLADLVRTGGRSQSVTAHKPTEPESK